MADRERKRSPRRKRKDRADRRRRDLAERRERMAARTEARNEAARDALEPLAEGERPVVVTIGAAISAVIALSVIAGYLADVEVRVFDAEGVARGDQKPPIAQVLAPTILLAIMAWGMWRTRYWAVLGFQVVLLIAILAASFGLVQATRIDQAVGNTILIAAAAAMFYFMIKALARIQMPERRPPDRR